MRLSPSLVVVGLVAAMIGSGSGEAQAAEGDLDPTFGTDGIVVTDFDRYTGAAAAVAIAIQQDGRIVAVGYANGHTDFGIARYNQDGSLDPTFGTDGKVVTDFGTYNDQPEAMAIQTDGKIIVAGHTSSDAILARYERDGTLDQTFAGGVVTDGLVGEYRATGLAIQQDRRIVVAGHFAPEGSGLFSETFLIRFSTDGTLDPTFGDGGAVTTPSAWAQVLAIQRDGQIITAGGRQTSFEGCAPWDPCDVSVVLARYNQDGSLDASFGVGGIVTTGRPGETNETYGIALQNDGKIVVVGARPTPLEPPDLVSDFLAHRFNSDGTLDSSFGAGGEVVTDFGAFDVARAVEVQADGKIVVAGGGRLYDPEAAPDFAVARYKTNGGLDVLFGDEGKVLVDVGGTDSAAALALQADGNIIAAGGGGDYPNGFALVRVMGTPPPSVAVGLVDPSAGRWYLRNEWGVIDSFYYGNPGDVPFLGDWDGDGIETPGLYRQSDGYVYLRNTNTQGIADIRFFFGNPGDVPLAGDFDGDGFDTVSIYRPSEQRFYIINELGGNDGGLGAADYSFVFGNPGDQPFVGDWDGDGVDEIGLHRASTGYFYYRTTLTTGIADGEFYFGNPGDRFVAGDWGVIDGRDTPAVFRPSNTVFYFRHTLTQGNADSQFTWPAADSDWIPIAGHFSTP